MRNLLSAGIAGLLILVFVAGMSSQVRDPAGAGASESRKGRGEISGTIVEASTGQPLRRATVSLNADVPLSMYDILTDDRGRFVFDQLPAGRFTVIASRPGFVRLAYGGGSVRLMPLKFSLLESQRLSGITIALTPAATMSGVVRGPTGAPVMGFNVVALRQMARSGNARELSPFATAQTDSDGRYRLTELPAGEYLVRASTPQDLPMQAAAGSGLRVVAGTFHPSAITAADGASVALAAGEDRTGVDVQLQLVPSLTLAGRVIVPSAGAAGNRWLVILVWPAPHDEYGQFRSPRAVQERADGSFEIGGLPSGRYFLHAYLPLGSGSQERRLTATKKITIAGHDVSDVELELRMPVVVSGRIEFRGAAQPPDPSEMQIVLPLAEGPSAGPPSGDPRTQVARDGSFHCDAPPGRYRIAQSWGRSYRGWWVQSAMLNGRDLLDDAFEVKPGEDISGIVFTLTDRPSELTGTVLDAAGKPSSLYMVAVFPVNQAFRTPGSRRVVSARVGLDGTFAITGLPPGEYFVATSLDIDGVQEHDPGFLQQLERRGPMRLTLGEGQQRKVAIRVGRAPE